jgi:hypothetical protein
MPGLYTIRYDGWKDVFLDRFLDCFVPFPVHALPEPVRGFVIEAAKAIGCDLSYVALPILAAIAASIGTSRRIRIKRGWEAFPILWVLIVGESGTTKTPAFRAAMRALSNRQRKAYKESEALMRLYKVALAQYEKELAEWKRDKNKNVAPPDMPAAPQTERFIVEDTTVEALASILSHNPRGLLLARDELAGWFGSFDRYAGGKGGSDEARFLSMHTGECLTVDRKSGADRMITVAQAAVSICGGIQPAILQRVLAAERRESGLAPRFLMAWPPRKPKRWTDDDIDPSKEAEIALLIERLFELQPTINADGEPQPVSLTMSADAKKRWVTFYNHNARENVELIGDLAAVWSKIEEYPARLALIVHCIRWAAGDPNLANDNEVDEASMQAGITLSTWFKGQARRVHSMLIESPADANRRKLTEWIALKGGLITAREVQMGCRWLRDPGLAEAALEALVKANLGTWESTSSGRPGQPTRRFRLTAASTVNSMGVFHYEKGDTVDVDTKDVPESFPQDTSQIQSSATHDDEWGEL